ncbi:MAG: TlyA family RNA methyltransferase [Bdellovibrionales bacterium]|nr:TlyA family RNA methyltransferase [Bdellovibrionales bacterium]
MRLDQFLVQYHNLESRHQAQRLITEGVVTVNSKVVTKNSYSVSDGDKVDITDHSILKFVSRAGLKLENAISALQLDVAGAVCLDVGQSTGGFTDCLLQRGAAKICGVEVGHGQLHDNLRNHPQVTMFEKTHILDIDLNDLGVSKLDIIVMDVSFISIVKIFSHLNKLSQPGTKLMSLVKPQFEVGPSYLTKAGVVKDADLYPQVEARIKEQLGLAGFVVHNYLAASPRGTDGNQEFFVYASKK